ncbi:helix-turn-helix domain-containing protein [Motilibacter aurantiacus]|uniref:helix-turn-helix domain-containing protein n=1 Tax=Motilibacter aurantiacus TaxID=2714955 RepID=UPI00140A2EF3|nr:helix-turn-helix domain-containing protein [Motilibacter aurantiacus]NHC43780.1 helix-turn-helix domain-containing protein [Motilibacter aurantiacus]
MTIGIAPAPHEVALVLFDGMSPFESGIVIEVFGLPRPELEVAWYSLSVCTPGGAAVRTVGGLTVDAPHGLEAVARAGTVIVPGVADVHGDVAPELLGALRAAHARGARVVSICSGAFALAQAGLLDGRRATTHWRYAPLLSERFPQVTVDADVLYTADADVYTSAGSAAGIDLCLHLIRLDHGATVANSVARRLVVPAHREGGQAQFIEAPVAQGPGDDAVARSMEWALQNLASPISLADLAARALMSPRSYSRHFLRRTGNSPVKWLTAQRVQASLPLLEAGCLSVEEVAAATGFESVVTFRQQFRRALSTSPTAYRRAFVS